MLVLEIFAGSLNHTIEIRIANLRDVTVDKTVGKAKGPISVLDLTVDENVHSLAIFV